MLNNIRFCYCSRLDEEPENESQCMIFGFTDRARDTLGESFIERISSHSEYDTGIPVGEDEDGSEVLLKIEKMEDNLYRIPTMYVEALMRTIFKYLPAYYQSPAERIKNKCSCHKI